MSGTSVNAPGALASVSAIAGPLAVAASMRSDRVGEVVWP